MALKYKVKKIEEVEEKFRDLYTQVGNEWILGVDGADDGAEVRKALRIEREAKEKLAEQIKKWEKLGKSDEEIAALLEEETKRATKKEEEAGNWEKLRTQMQDQHNGVLSKRDERIEFLQGALASALIDADATRTIVEAKGDPELLLPHVKAHTKVVEKDGKFHVQVVDAKGDPRVNGQGEFLGITDLVTEMKEGKFKRAFDGTSSSGGGTPSGGSGSGGSGSGNGGGGSNKTRSQMSIDDKSSYIAKHGREAYMKLPYK